jgi:hypothetical protein
MELLMRGAVLVLAFAVAACTPEIVSGVYFCGPEMLCPPDQLCSPDTALCVRPALVQPFACPAGSQDLEPNNDVASATTMTFTTCPGPEQRSPACMPDPADIDLIAIDAPCPGGALSLDVRFPVAFSPIVVEQIEVGGAVIASATSCAIAGDESINDAACLDVTVPAGGRVYIRFSLDPEIDCDDACAFNWYDVAATIQ